MTLMSVVLPAPLGPTTQVSSPAPIVSEISDSAVAVPYFATMASSTSMSLPEKSRYDVRLFHHFRGRTFGDHRAVIEDDHAVRKRHDRTHHVLDEQNRRPGVTNRAD